MCTVTWLRHNHGDYAVFFNRDEQRRRATAHPPAVHNTGGVRYLAALDGEAGGTWLAANEHGLTLGLLNYYEAEHVWRACQPRSRGLLVLSLIDEPELDEVTRRVRDLRADEYHPFILVAFDRRTTRAHTWDGRRIGVRDLGEEDLPLSTSSFDTPSVLARRGTAFRRLRETQHGLTPASLQQFHDSHDPHGGAYSVCMSRQDAHTVSFSRVRVTAGEVEFFYEPRADGRPAGASAIARLPRA